MNTPALLETARAAFNAYCAERVSLSAGLSSEAMDRLSFAEVAARIPNPEIRARYVELAIGMLEANISDHRALAPAVEPEKDSSTPVVAALVGAAAAYWLLGPVAALLAAALLYWSFARQAKVVLHESTKNAEAHNAQAVDWQQTIEKWGSAIRELRRVET